MTAGCNNMDDPKQNEVVVVDRTSTSSPRDVMLYTSTSSTTTTNKDLVRHSTRSTAKETSLHGVSGWLGESSTSLSFEASWAEDSTASFDVDYLTAPQEIEEEEQYYDSIRDRERRLLVSSTPCAPPSCSSSKANTGRPQLPPRTPSSRSICATNSSGGRRCPRRGLSASCSALNFDISSSSFDGGACSTTTLSREQSKLSKLSNHSHSSSTTSRRRAAPLRSGSSGSHQQQSQLQVGDMVLLANKELSTSSHLRRSMPSRTRSSTEA